MPRRVVIVTRRFWPLVGGAERMTARLAAALAARLDRVTILTARWDRHWPEEIEHHGVRVVRLRQSQLRWWGTWQYMQAISRWLTQQRDEVDLVYVSMLKHDAYAAIGFGDRHGVPVVLRAEGAGMTGDVCWQLEANFGYTIKRRCVEAAAVVAPSPAIERELVAAGYRRDRIHYIPNAVPLPPPLTDDQRRQALAEARTALASANPSLAVPNDAPLAVFTGRICEEKGLNELVDAWSRVVQSRPDAHLMLVGEGPLRAELALRLQSEELTENVVLAGAFDDVEDFLRAADLFVLPSWEEGLSLALLEAMAAELPVVVSDIAANRVVVDDQRHGLLVPVRDVESLATAILRILNDPAGAAQFGASARQRVADDFSLDRCVASHLDLFAQVCPSRGSAPRP
ncbi:MAG: glycosyltransferase family 4 protein [Planctomycetales bacterium]|nr:glycosyltransferase family 4 protein [Planctomycetales bacterium]